MFPHAKKKRKTGWWFSSITSPKRFIVVIDHDPIFEMKNETTRCKTIG